MLQRMREGLSGWVAWLIIGALILSMSLFGVSFYLHGDSGAANKGLAAKVNAVPISEQEVDGLLKQFNTQNPLPTLSTEENNQRRQMILQSLIDRDLLVWLAAQNHFQVSHNQLLGAVFQIPQFQVEGKFSTQRYNTVLAEYGYTSAGFLAKLQNDLLLNQIQSSLAFTTLVLPSDATMLTQHLKQTRDLSYVVLPFEKQSAPKMELTKAVPDYYTQHLSDFQTPEKMQVQYVVLGDEDLAKNIAPSTSTLKSLYESNLNQYTEPAQYQFAHLLINTDPQEQTGKIKKVEAALAVHQDFGGLVKSFSDDLITVDAGGALPFMTESTLPPALQKLAPTLKIGQIAGPLKTEQGTEWIKLLAIKPAAVTPFEKVEAQIRKQYLESEVQKRFGQKTQQLQDLIFQNPNSLDAAAKALGLHVQTSEWLFAKKPATGIFANASVMAAVFSDSVKLGNNSDVLYPNPHTAVVLRVKTYQAATTLPLSAVSTQIQTLLIEKARAELTQSLATKLADDIKQGASLESVSKQYGLQWTSLKNLSRHEPASKVHSLILSTAFKLPAPHSAHQANAGTVVVDKGVAVVVVTGVHMPQDISKSEIAISQKQLEQYYDELTLRELLNFYRHKAKIEIYQAQARAD